MIETETLNLLDEIALEKAHTHVLDIASQQQKKNELESNDDTVPNYWSISSFVMSVAIMIALITLSLIHVPVFFISDYNTHPMWSFGIIMSTFFTLPLGVIFLNIKIHNLYFKLPFTKKTRQIGKKQILALENNIVEKQEKLANFFNEENYTLINQFLNNNKPELTHSCAISYYSYFLMLDNAYRAQDYDLIISCLKYFINTINTFDNQNTTSKELNLLEKIKTLL